MSEIFERLQLLQPYLAKNRTALAERLGVDESTLSGQIRRKSNNIYPLLPRIFDFLPELSAEWLYLGKGRMFFDSTSSTVNQAKECTIERPLADIVAQQQETIRKLTETNQKLVDELLKKNLKGE